MASKKKSIKPRCVCCGLRAVGMVFGVEPVCANAACFVAIEEAVKSFIAENKKK